MPRSTLLRLLVFRATSAVRHDASTTGSGTRVKELAAALNITSLHAEIGENSTNYDAMIHVCKDRARFGWSLAVEAAGACIATEAPASIRQPQMIVYVLKIDRSCHDNPLWGDSSRTGGVHCPPNVLNRT